MKNRCSIDSDVHWHRTRISLSVIPKCFNLAVDNKQVDILGLWWENHITGDKSNGAAEVLTSFQAEEEVKWPEAVAFHFQVNYVW